MDKARQSNLDDKVKNAVASEIADLFFEFWQNRRSQQEIEAVAPTPSFPEDSCSGQQP